MYELLGAEVASHAPHDVAHARRKSEPLKAHEIDTGCNELGRYIGRCARRHHGIFGPSRPTHFRDRVSQHMPRFFPWWKDRVFRHL